MPDLHPDGVRARPESRAGAAPPPYRRRPLLPLALAIALTLVVVLAAMRGGGDSPTLVPSSEVADRSAAPGTDASATGGAEAPAEAPAEPPTADADADVLPTATTPTPAPAPTVRVEDLPMSGSGEFVGAPGAPAPFGAAPHRRFAVAVERGIGVEVDELAAFVDTVLSDDRSWIGDGITGFRRVAPDEAVDFTIVVATPDTVDRLCAPLQTAGRYSCATNGWVALNLHRWMTATPGWPASLEVYRHYLVNHEVGHYILGPDHPGCPEPGALAPIMMQQTIDLAGCRPNGWVFPRRS